MSMVYWSLLTQIYEKAKKTANLMMMMIAFITFKSSLVPLFEGLWSSNSWKLKQTWTKVTKDLFLSAKIALYKDEC